MGLNYERLADVTTETEPTENANVLIEDGGTIKRCPIGSIGGGAGGFIVRFSITQDFGDGGENGYQDPVTTITCDTSISDIVAAAHESIVCCTASSVVEGQESFFSGIIMVTSYQEAVMIIASLGEMMIVGQVADGVDNWSLMG